VSLTYGLLGAMWRVQQNEAGEGSEK
jgi:hypothetical protein